MPKKPPPIWPKGTRPPNSGRKKGVPNKISAEARTLASQLVNDVIYQTKLRDDFRRRRVHPTIEALNLDLSPRQTHAADCAQRLASSKRAPASTSTREPAWRTIQWTL